MHATDQHQSDAQAHHNLPAQLTSFVAREAEVAAVRQLLQSDTVRLVTLTGMEPSTTARAARLLATAESLRLEIGLKVPPVERAEEEARLATLRDKLGEGIFTTAYQEGQLMEMQQAVAYAPTKEIQAEG